MANDLYSALNGSAAAPSEQTQMPVDAQTQPANDGASQLQAITIGPPKDENELLQRKSGWGQVMQRINDDPNLRRAMMVMGFSMMQPGSNFGTSALKGMAAYEGGEKAMREQQRQQQQDARELARDKRAQEQHDLQLQQGRDMLEFNAKKRPLELQQLQAEIDAMPDKREAARLTLALRKLELEQAPEKMQLERERVRASIEASKRAGDAATRETDQEKAIKAYMAMPEVQELPIAMQRARATQLYMRDTRGLTTGMKQESADEDAVAYFEYVMSLPEEDQLTERLTMDAKTKAMYARGARLAGGQNAPAAQTSPSTGTSAASTKTPATSKPISAAEIREALKRGAKQEASGQIRQGE